MLKNILRFTSIAFTGHISWQQKHLMQFFILITALPSVMVIVFCGHISLQLPQPMQAILLIFGFGASSFSTVGVAQRMARGTLSEKSTR